MKRLVLTCLVSLCAPHAMADTELARAWGAKAAALYEDSVAILEGGPVTDVYRAELGRFAVTSQRLGHWADRGEAPKDLACIFRGMAKESSDQLSALGNGHDQQAARRLVVMFNDAEAISASAIIMAGKPQSAGARNGAVHTCPAAPWSDQYFTEQP